MARSCHSQAFLYLTKQTGCENDCNINTRKLQAENGACGEGESPLQATAVVWKVLRGGAGVQTSPQINVSWQELVLVLAV